MTLVSGAGRRAGRRLRAVLRVRRAGIVAFQGTWAPITYNGAISPRGIWLRLKVTRRSFGWGVPLADGKERFL